MILNRCKIKSNVVSHVKNHYVLSKECLLQTLAEVSKDNLVQTSVSFVSDVLIYGDDLKAGISERSYVLVASCGHRLAVVD